MQYFQFRIALKGKIRPRKVPLSFTTQHNETWHQSLSECMRQDLVWLRTSLPKANMTSYNGEIFDKHTPSYARSSWRALKKITPPNTADSDTCSYKSMAHAGNNAKILLSPVFTPLFIILHTSNAIKELWPMLGLHLIHSEYGF